MINFYSSNNNTDTDIIYLLTFENVVGDTGGTRNVGIFDCACNSNNCGKIDEKIKFVKAELYNKKEEHKQMFYITMEKNSITYYLGQSSLMEGRKTLNWEEQPKHALPMKIGKKNNKYYIIALIDTKQYIISYSVYKPERYGKNKCDNSKGSKKALLGIYEEVKDNINIAYIYNTKIIKKINDLYSS